MSIYHEPVLLHESIEGLSIKEDGVYVDATFGGGGHSREILKKLKSGKLIAFDQDDDAIANAPDDDRFIFIKGNFRYLKRFLMLYKIQEVDGILADLGVSSHQIDTGERGFSIRFDGPLDMRMDKSGELTAADILNTYNEQSLQHLFGSFGEVRNARQLARRIVEDRSAIPFTTTYQLVEFLKTVAKGSMNKYLATVFQALRMEVNHEFDALKEFLESSMELLKKEGRLVVISYHSIEDRLVKQFMKWGTFGKAPESDIYGHVTKPFRLITKKPTTPDLKELKENPRSRSAKLRVAEKI